MGNKSLEGMSKTTTSSQEMVSDILILQFTIINAFLIEDSSFNF